MSPDTDQLEQTAQTLHSVIDARIQSAHLSYTKDPENRIRDLIEYESRMVVQGMEKFNDPCFIVYTNFYKTEAEQTAGDSIGALILYLEEENAARFLKATGYKVKADDEDEVIQEQLLEFFGDILKSFKSKVPGLSRALHSEPASYKNTIPDGIPFHYDEYHLAELTYHLWKAKVLSLDLTVYLDKTP